MFTCELILAAALLSPKSPTASEPLIDVGGPVHTSVLPAAWIQVLRPSLVALAMEAEILDPREKASVLTQDLAGELAMLQARSTDASGSPVLGEGLRFPDRKLINDFLALNRAFRNDLVARQAVDLVHAEDLRTAIVETDQLYQVWDTVRDARCDYYYVTVRRQALRLLRDLIGAEAFYAGQLPPHVPVWHLPRREP